MRSKRKIVLEVGEDALAVCVTRNGIVVAEHTLHAPCEDGSLAYLKGGPEHTDDRPPAAG